MTISADFDAITTPKTPTTYLADEWDGLARAIKSCKQIGVALDAGEITVGATGTMNIGDPGTESDNIVVGGSTFESHLKVSEFGGTIDAMIQAHRHSTSFGANMLLTRSKSDDSSHTIVADNDILGTIYFAGNSGNAGTGYLLAAQIDAVVDGTPSTTSMPTELTFRTTPVGSTSPTIRLTIGPDGTVTANEDLVVGDGASGSGARTVTLNSELNNAADVIFQTAGSEFWRLGMGEAQEFTIDSRTGAGCVTIEENAPANAIFVSSDGHVGLGLDPTTFDFAVQNGGDASHFGSGDDDDYILSVGAGFSTEQNADIAWRNRSLTVEWTLRKEAAGNFVLLDGATSVMTFEDGADANSVYVDAAGHVGLGADPTAMWGFDCRHADIRFDEQADDNFIMRLGSGDGTTVRLCDLTFDENGTIRWRIRKDGTNDLGFYDSSSALTVNIWDGGGVTIGSPTGSDQGAGTLNATAVYDDGALLTCYVYDAEFDGQIDQRKWDGRVPDRKARVIDPDGVTRERVIEARTHEPAKRFAARAAETLDPRAYTDAMVARRALLAFPDERTWDPENDKLSSGELIQRLWEEVEVAAVHRAKLLARIEALENA